MTEQNETTTRESKKDLARRWGIVGLGVTLAAALVAKSFSDEDETDEELEVDIDPEAGNTEVIIEAEEV